MTLGHLCRIRLLFSNLRALAAPPVEVHFGLEAVIRCDCTTKRMVNACSADFADFSHVVSWARAKVLADSKLPAQQVGQIISRDTSNYPHNHHCERKDSQ